MRDSGVKDSLPDELGLHEDEAVLVQAAGDLTGELAFGRSRVIVTDRRVLLLDAGRREFPLADITAARLEPAIGGGRMVLECNGRDPTCVYFSGAATAQIAEAAAVIERIRSGMPTAPAGVETTNPAPGKGRLLRRLAAYLRPYRRQAVALIVVLFAGAAAELMVPLIIKWITDDALIGRRSFRLVAWLVAGLFCVRLILWAVESVRGCLTAWLGSHVVADMRTEMHTRLEHLPLRFYDASQVGALTSRIIRDCGSVEEFLATALPLLLVNAFTLAGILVFLFLSNWVVALCICIPIPLIGIVAAVVWRRLRPAFRRQNATWARLSAHLNECLSGIRVVKAFSQEPRELARFERNNRDLRDAATAAERGSFAFFTIIYFLMNLGMLLVWYIGGGQVLTGRMTLGQLLAAVAYVWMLYWPLQWFGQISAAMNQAFAAAERIFETLDTPTEPYHTPDDAPLPEIEGRVRFRNVTFGYAPSTSVLRNVEFEVRAGEMIGIVGRSGMGKTTILNLLCRFYEPDAGTVEVDGRDIRTVRLEDLRSQIGIVPQDPFLFSGTVAANIAYGRPEASFEEILEAAHIAQAHSFIMAKPDGYDTQVGDRGCRLSGGERQRIAIARAVLRNPRILILDEATSSLDIPAEKAIQTAIGSVTRNRTTFVIAHRLSTVRDASRLIVLEEGRIAEIGTHAELMAHRGLFYAMVRAQKYVWS